MFANMQAPDGESQPSTEVDLFISTEKIMVLNTDLKVSELILGCLMNYGHFLVSLLRIRDVYPGSEFSYPGSRVENIPDPDPHKRI
jgi:hypothetical protein